MPDTITAKQLREQRANVAQQMRELVQQANQREDDPGLSDEEREKFDKMHDEEQRLLRRAEDLERVEGLFADTGELSTPLDLSDHANHAPRAETSSSEEQRDQMDIFRRWATRQIRSSELPEEYRFTWGDDRSQVGFRVAMPGYDGLEQRATTAQSLVAAKGGNVVADEIMRGLEEALKAFGGVREVATVIRTDTGANLPVPTVNESTQVASILAINTAAVGQDITFGQKTFTAYKYTSNVVLVPMELMQDSSINLPAFISRALGTRFGRGTNAHYTTGNTTDTQPQGIVSDSVAGVTAATQNAVTYAELVQLEHSVDPAYRRGARWMMHDSTLRRIKELVDSQGRPLYQPTISGASPDTILGYPFTINQDMAELSTATGAAKKAILFGAFDRFWVRDVRDVVILRLDERYAEKAQTGFVGFMRTDSGGVIASTNQNPWKHLISST